MPPLTVAPTKPRLPVFYTPRMVADSGSYSPSAGKPRVVVESWLNAGGRPRVRVDVHEPAPCTEAELCRAHDPAYVRGVLDGTRANGFGNRRPDVAASLAYTSGAMLAAARHALAHPDAPAACAPVSGFHHAGYDFGGGYCTFGGLMVAAEALLSEGLARRVGILDADMHYGNGTDDIIAKLGERRVDHVTFGADYHRPEQAAGFLRKLPGVVRKMARACDVVIYQAGADPFVEDPLGGWLTMEQLAERDRLVFEGCRAAGTPVAWDFAGGYKRDPDGVGISAVVAIHTATARAALRAAENVRASG